MEEMFERVSSGGDEIMSTTWIDLTDIEQWAGHHGGTQRVVYGIAKNYYLARDNNVRFFAYSPDKNIFYETSFEPIYQRVEGQKSVDTPSQSSLTSYKQRLKIKLLHYSPHTLRNNVVLKSNVKKTLRYGIKSVKKADSIRQRLVGKIGKQMNIRTNDIAITFHKNDTILILGKPWDNPGLQKQLTKSKAETGFKVVQVVYDLIISLYPHLHHPSLFKSYTQHMFGAVVVSDLLLPISKSSENDLFKFCGILNLPVPKTAVIRLGDEIEIDQITDKPGFDIDEKFLLCVGTLENRKNHTLLYQAYKLANQKGIDLPQLVIIGGAGWLADDIKYLITHDPAMIGKIEILHGVSDSSLAWLYSNCLLTVFPSLYEGWGLPVAESMAHGKFCLSSSISSMPEIGGDLVGYFSPYDPNDFLQTLVKYTDNGRALMLKESNIKKHYKTTGWSQTYSQVKQYVLDIK